MNLFRAYYVNEIFKKLGLGWASVSYHRAEGELGRGLAGSAAL